MDEYLINKYDLGDELYVKNIDFVEIDSHSANLYFKNGNTQSIKCDHELCKTIKSLFRFIPCLPICYDVSENVNSLQIVFKIGAEIYSINVEKSTSDITSSSVQVKGIDVDGDDWILKLSKNPIEKLTESETNIPEKRKRGRPKNANPVSKSPKLPKNQECNQNTNHMCPFCSSFETVSNATNHIKICPVRKLFNKNKKPDSTFVYIPMCSKALDLINYMELMLPLCDNIKNSLVLINCLKDEQFQIDAFKMKMMALNLDSVQNPVFVFASFNDELFSISQMCCEFVKSTRNCSIVQFFSQTLKHPKTVWGDLLFHLFVKGQYGFDTNV
jgi:hypothetical protein